jgi:alkane 1-monooxygenase
MHSAIGSDGEQVQYLDRKRYLWLAGLSGPFVLPLAIGVYFWSGHQIWWLLLPLVYIYFGIPFADGVLGEDTHNPPEAIVPALSRDGYYRALLYIDVVLLYLSFGFSVWFVGTQALPWWAFLVVALSAGLSSVDALTIGHELGHKPDRFGRMFAEAALTLVAYGHFRIEHNRGHHAEVATPEDSASARMGESVYRFALRELPGAITRGWALERERLARRERGAWSLSNEILRSWLLSAAIAAAITIAFGPKLLLFLLIHHLQAWYGLTQANYVEHYGLLRQKLASGAYEPTAPRHSWNTNHIFSNLIMFHLQRHSDHHAHALRPYQALRDSADLPRLPNGYPGCFGLAAIPRLWFEVMDPKLLEWAGGDLDKINIDPKHRDAIYARYAPQRSIAPVASGANS